MFKPRFYSRVSLFTALIMMVVDAVVGLFQRRKVEEERRQILTDLSEERDRWDFYAEHPQFYKGPAEPRGWTQRDFDKKPYGRKWK